MDHLATALTSAQKANQLAMVFQQQRKNFHRENGVKAYEEALELGTLNALIAIAQELRKLNESLA
jgi:hypothetical protein